MAREREQEGKKVVGRQEDGEDTGVPPGNVSGRDTDTSEDVWKRVLSSEAFDVLRRGETEPPWSGEYGHRFWEPGAYACAGCGTALFDSGATHDTNPKASEVFLTPQPSTFPTCMPVGFQCLLSSSSSAPPSHTPDTQHANSHAPHPHTNRAAAAMRRRQILRAVWVACFLQSNRRSSARAT